MPGIVYASPAQIDWSSLAGCDDMPQVDTVRFDAETVAEVAGDPSGRRGTS